MGGDWSGNEELTETMVIFKHSGSRVRRLQTHLKGGNNWTKSNLPTQTLRLVHPRIATFRDGTIINNTIRAVHAIFNVYECNSATSETSERKKFCLQVG